MSLNQTYIRFFQGAVLSFAPPIGWLFILSLQGINVFTAINSHPLLFAYLFFTTLIVFPAFGYYVGSQEDKLKNLSQKDFLTGLYNVRSFHEQLIRAVELAKREHEPLCLIFFDIDHFKKVNDQYGHAVGDLVISALADQAHLSLRNTEFIARVGGEEFATILPKRSLDQSRNIAQRLLDDVRKLTIDHNDLSIQITISIGISSLDIENSADDLYALADQKMYQAKTNGRNQISA